MTFDQWIATASSVGTVIATIVAAASIWVIQRQNRMQYRPRITIADTLFNIIDDDRYDHQVSPNNNQLGMSSQDFRVSLLNVGNGVATHLEVQWNYDIENLASLCRCEATDAKKAVKFTVGHQWLHVIRGSRVQALVRLPSSYKVRIDYIAPVAVQANGYPISLDLALLELTKVFYSNPYSSNPYSGKNLSSKVADRKIDISLVVKYLDSLGGKYEEVIPMIISLAIWRGASEGDFAETVVILKRKI